MKPKNDDQNLLGERLRELRRLAAMTQQEAADHLGIRRSTYAYYETGAIRPSLETLQQLALEFRVTVDYLLDREETNSSPLVLRQESHDPLSGAKLMGECDREERAFLSLLRRMDTEKRQKLLGCCYDLLTDNGANSDALQQLLAEHIHFIDE